MARHLRVPGIVDVVLVSSPAEIRALNDQPKIDRNFIPLGPLMNRFIVGRIRRWFEIMGQLLPSLTPRDDRVRVDRQQQLAAALDSEHESSQGSMLWAAAALARMRALRALPTATSFSDDAVLGQCLGRHRSTRVDMWTITARNAYTVFRKGRDWGFHHFRKLSGYVAEPTDGLWLRTPYLHNGSVPTLADLLEQPQNKPKAFLRGRNYLIPPVAALLQHRTIRLIPRANSVSIRSLPGNSNAGHLYGTDLDQAEKADLLAYLLTKVLA